jgi:AcrR family transcriptional regulator
VRSDTERNRQLLMDAAETLMAETTESVTMRQIASAAGVSAATAYRYFGSVNGLVEAFRSQAIEGVVEFSNSCEEQGIALLDAVCCRWVQVVTEHGKAMSHTRSRIGYLSRLGDGAPDLMMQQAAMRRPLAEACSELGLPDLGDMALFVWNQIFDPRDVLDLMDVHGWSSSQVSARLLSTLIGALRGSAAAL